MSTRGRVSGWVFAVAAVAALPLLPASAQQAKPTPLLAQLEGGWAVEQTTWDGPGSRAKTGQRATAVRRSPAGGGFIEETMTGSGPEGAPFTRIAHLNYNVTARMFEYATVDTRAPQQMHYRSQPVASSFIGALALRGGTFVAAEWAGKRNVGFAYRIVLSPVTGDHQRLDLFFTPLAGQRREFLATRYEYRRL